jgi:cell division protein FtsL
MVLARVPAQDAKGLTWRRRGAARAGLLSRHPEYVGILILAVCVLLALSLVALPATTAALGYEIVRLRQQLEALERDRALLELEIARLESLERIEQTARDRLGMREPEVLALVELDGQPGPGGGADSVWQPEPDGAVMRLAAAARQFIVRAVSGRPAQAGSGR